MTGVLPSQRLRQLIETGVIAATPPIDPAQIQPASLDLRLGATAYRVRASFLTGAGATVQDRLTDFGMHQVDLTGGATGGCRTSRAWCCRISRQSCAALPPDKSAFPASVNHRKTSN